MITELDHKRVINADDEVQIYWEEEFKEGGPYAFDVTATTRYQMQDLPYKIEGSKPKKSDLDPGSVSGVSQLAWSFDSKYLATKNE